VAFAPRAGGADDDIPVVAGRHTTHSRIHRKVVHLQRRRTGRALLARGDWRADECRLGVLLSPNRGHDVHDRGAGDAPAAHSPPGRGGSGNRRGRGLLSRYPAHASAGSRARLDLDDLLKQCFISPYTPSMVGRDYWLSIAELSTPDDLREHILTGFKSGKPFTPYVPTIALPAPLDRVLDFGCGVGR